jgi:hypothetical protein
LIDNDASDVIEIDDGGTYQFAVAGDFGGSTVTLQQLGPDGVKFIDIPDCAFTNDGFATVALPSGAKMRADIAGQNYDAMHATLALIRA